MLWRSIHRSASTRTPQPNKRQQSVGAGREARSGAIRRDHAARQCSAAHLGRVAALCTPCSLSGCLFTPLLIRFGGSGEQANKRTNNAVREHQNGASRPRSAGMSSALSTGTGLYGACRSTQCCLAVWSRWVESSTRLGDGFLHSAQKDPRGALLYQSELYKVSRANQPWCDRSCRGLEPPTTFEFKNNAQPK